MLFSEGVGKQVISTSVSKIYSLFPPLNPKLHYLAICNRTEELEFADEIGTFNLEIENEDAIEVLAHINLPVRGLDLKVPQESQIRGL